VTVRRTSYATTVSDILSSNADSKLCFFVPPSFVPYANGLIREALLEHGLGDDNQPYVKAVLEDPLGAQSTSTNVPVNWRIDSVCSWQQIDRRIDEYVMPYLFYKLQSPAVFLAHHFDEIGYTRCCGHSIDRTIR
jgi:hypothetical protein